MSAYTRNWDFAQNDEEITSLTNKRDNDKINDVACAVAATVLLPIKNNSLLQETLNGGRCFSDPEWKQNFLIICQASRKLCGLMEGFLSSDEVAARSLISCIMCVTLWFGRGADFCSVSL